MSPNDNVLMWLRIFPFCVPYDETTVTMTTTHSDSMLEDPV
jgi:hypothetical protein